MSEETTMKVAHQFPEGELVISMTNYKGLVLIVTNKGVYKFTMNGVEQVTAEPSDDPEETIRDVLIALQSGWISTDAARHSILRKVIECLPDRYLDGGDYENGWDACWSAADFLIRDAFDKDHDYAY